MLAVDRRIRAAEDNGGAKKVGDSGSGFVAEGRASVRENLGGFVSRNRK